MSYIDKPMPNVLSVFMGLKTKKNIMGWGIFMKIFSIRNKMAILMIVVAVSIGLLGFLSISRMNSQKDTSLERLNQQFDKTLTLKLKNRWKAFMQFYKKLMSIP